jgi:DNA-binding NarL/FixJ family response regulator
MTERASKSDRMRVILADPDPIARAAMRRGFDGANGFLVTADTGDGREAAELATHYRPDVTLLAGDLPGLDGPAACRRIHTRAPDVAVLFLASGPDPERELAALRAGASGLVAKEAGIDAIVAMARLVAQGGLAVSSEVTRVLVERMRLLPESGVGMRPVRSPLTAREWEVLDLLTEERTTPQIAGELYLTQDTVKSHVKSILRKLDVHSRAEAVARGAQLRWVLLPHAA